VRANWQCLGGPWRFAFDDQGRWERPDDVEAWTHTIEVPFAPESAASGIGDRGFHCNYWYERDVEIPPGEGRVLLHFGAVDYRARVWVNGQFVVAHEGGHTPFLADITLALRSTGLQRITVWAQDDPHDLAKPRGKQDWQPHPHGIWYPRTSGIWQTVWLERVSDIYIGRLRWTPHLERWEIGFEAFLKGRLSGELTLRLRLSVHGRLLIDDTYRALDGEVHRRIALPDPGIDDSRNELLWSPERPTLFQAEIELWDGECCLDRVQSYTALRSVGTQRDRFLLNGRHYYLRLVLDQGYWPETLMTAPSDEALRRDVELVKAMGFNGVRKHQKIEDPRFLYWADVLGLMVWEEMPSAYRFTPKAVERIAREWTEAIERDFSHPCIVVWVPFNESWGVPDLSATPAHRHYVRALYHLTRTLDSTRPVIGNDGWETTAADIIGIHDYDHNLRRLVRRYEQHHQLSVEDLLARQRPGGRLLTLDDSPHQGQPVMLTEFGGIAYAPDSGTWGYVRCHSAEELQRSYTRLLATVHCIRLFAGFCYTQLTDTFQEANGLLTADRTPKFPLAAIAAATLGSGQEDDDVCCSTF
jgi:beta-galactosidase/beta-glucuronidase